MPTDLRGFGLTGMLHCSLGLRKAAAGTRSVEGAARAVCRYLHDELRDVEPPASDGVTNDGRQCTLVRFYVARPRGAPPAEVARFAAARLRGAVPTATMRCLCLLGTAGDAPAWNDRRESRGHQAIPLPSPQI